MAGCICPMCHIPLEWMGMDTLRLHVREHREATLTELCKQYFIPERGEEQWDETMEQLNFMSDELMNDLLKKVSTWSFMKLAHN